MSQHFYPEILETGAILNLTLSTGLITVDLNQSFLIQGVLINTNDRSSGTGVNGSSVDVTGFTSQSDVHLRYTMDGNENPSLGLEPDMFYAVLGSADTAGTSSTSYDLYIANFDVDASDNVTITQYVSNKSKLVIDSITSQVHNAGVTVPATITATTFTLNDAETGAGVTGGSAGIVIERGTSTNYQLLMDDNTTPHLTAGLEGAMKKVAIFSSTPVTGQILAAADDLGNLTSADNLKWDAVNKRLAVDQAGGNSFTVTEAIHTDGNYQGGQWVMMGHAESSIGFNVDKDDQYITNGYASKLVSSGGTFTISVSAASGVAGQSVVGAGGWDILYAWNELGNLGFNIAASSNASETLSLGGNLYMSASAPKINVNDTSGMSGLRIDVAGVSGTNPFFTIYDTDDTSNVFQITYDRDVIWSTGQLNLQNPIDAENTVLHIQSVDEEAKLILNSTDDLYSSVNTASIYQQSEDHATPDWQKSLFITTGTGAGNIVLAPKYDGASSATGYVGINQLNPTKALDVTGTARIYQTSSPSLTFQNGTASWITYMGASNSFCVGATTSTYALRVQTSYIDSDDDFVWNRNTKRLGLGYTILSGGESYKLHVKSAETEQLYLKGTSSDAGLKIDSFTNANSLIKFVQDGSAKVNLGFYNDTTDYFGVYCDTKAAFGLKIYENSNDVEFDGSSFYYDVSADSLLLGDYATLNTNNASIGSNIKICADSDMTVESGGIEYQVSAAGSGYGFRSFSGYDTNWLENTLAVRYNSSTWSNAFKVYYDNVLSNPDEKIMVHVGPYDVASDADYKSTLTLAGCASSGLSSPGGVEFKMSTVSSGSGVRLIPVLGASQTSLIIAHRYQATTWTQTLSVTRTASETIINLAGLPSYANETEAAALSTGDLYRSTSGDQYLKIKI